LTAFNEFATPDFRCMLHTKQAVKTNHSVEFLATSDQSFCNKSRL